MRDGGAHASPGLLEALRPVIAAYPLSAALKEIMARHTGDVAWRTVRPPLMRLDDAGGAALMEALAGTGFSLPPAP